jgi:hypothetical protein
MRSWIASPTAIRPYRYNGGPNAGAPGHELIAAPGSKKDATDVLALSADVSAAAAEIKYALPPSRTIVS